MESEGGLSRESLNIALIDDEPKYCNQGRLKLIIITICVSTAYYGWSVINLFAVPQIYLQTSYGSQINESTIHGVLQGCVPGGAIIGAGIASTVMRLLTRKKYVLLTNLLALAIYGVIQIPQYLGPYGMPIAAGCFSGLYMAIVLIYIYELSPKQLAGFFGVYTNLIAVAIVLCFGLQIIFQQAVDQAPEPFWRIIWLVPAITVIIQSVLLLSWPCSRKPTSLLITGRREEAREFLSQFHKEQYQKKTSKLVRKKQGSRQKEQKIAMIGQRSANGRIDGLQASSFAAACMSREGISVGRKYHRYQKQYFWAFIFLQS